MQRMAKIKASTFSSTGKVKDQVKDQRHLHRPRLRPQRQPSRPWAGFSISQITTTKIRPTRLEGVNFRSRTSRRMPIPRFSQSFHRNLNMDRGLKLPGEDWTRLALGI